MSVNTYISSLPDLELELIGNTIYHYIFYSLIFVSSVLLVIRYQSRSLRQARRLLKEKQLAYDEIARQREELEVKNRNITDSLVYASYIQRALLPSDIYFVKLLPVSFIFYKPKEIVSGDFYWIRESSDKIFLVAADCTGHGVPGAFMSMIGVELLNKIIIDQKIETPSEILYVLSKGIERTFSGDDSGIKVLKDGMDIGLCVIDMKTRELEYAGAFFPLYIIRDNKLNEIKGDRISVGLASSNEFTNNHFKLENDDMVYLFSDGYTDQFGGPHDKKFMYRRFRHLLLTIHGFSMDEQRDIIRDSIKAWKGKNDQVDDLMVIGFKPFSSKGKLS